MVSAVLWSWLAAPPPGWSAAGQLLRHVTTVAVAPDGTFANGDLVRVNTLPARHRLVVTFRTRELPQPMGGCFIAGLALKENERDMQATGAWGVLNCQMPDMGLLMVGDTCYFVSMSGAAGSEGWRVCRDDATTWAKLAAFCVPLAAPFEGTGDPMVAFVNARIDINGGAHRRPSSPRGLQRAASRARGGCSASKAERRRKVARRTTARAVAIPPPSSSG